jgi:peptidoglycan hydrolase FlgJ
MPVNNLGTSSYVDLNKNRAENLSRVSEDAENEKLLEVCREFESIFVNMMLKTMRGTVDDESSLVPKSEGTKMFEQMHDEEMSRKLSLQGAGFGLADTLFNHMKASKAYRQNG